MRFRRPIFLTSCRRYATVIDVLRSRGLLSASTHSSVDEHLRESRKIYLGFDPTGDSLHLGHILPMVVVVHMAKHGHSPILLIGGASAAIGDPSGKDHERNLLDMEAIRENSSLLKEQLKSLFVNIARRVDFDVNRISFVNNTDWYTSMNILTFFREIGIFSRVSSMLNKDIVKRRMENQQGINYSEFSYQLFQSYDFYYLYRKHGCTVQIGGHDQWGNITTGIEYIQKRMKAQQPQVFGITVPLLTSKNGMKFGKTAGSPIWLDETKTSPYQMYQYLLNLPDEHMNQYLHMFTLREKSEIEQIMREHLRFPENRVAQKTLASDVTKLIHGDEKAIVAEDISKGLFNKANLVPPLVDIIPHVPRASLSKEIFSNVSLIEALLFCRLVTSKCK
jgi:tyrosyl-tRNA synthetase